MIYKRNQVTVSTSILPRRYNNTNYNTLVHNLSELICNNPCKVGIHVKDKTPFIQVYDVTVDDKYIISEKLKKAFENTGFSIKLINHRHGYLLVEFDDNYNKEDHNVY